MSVSGLLSRARPARGLVVDDERHITKLNEYMLKREGYEVTVSHDGAQALSSVEACAPDAVLLDLVMSGLSGLDVLRRLRADDRYDATVIIVLTGRSFDEMPGELTEVRVDHYCVKPVAPSTLIKRLLDCGIHPLIEEQPI